MEENMEEGQTQKGIVLKLIFLCMEIFILLFLICLSSMMLGGGISVCGRWRKTYYFHVIYFIFLSAVAHSSNTVS